MAYSFTNWAQTIADISTRPEFQNAHVVLYVPAHGGEYDVDTGETTGGTEAELLYDGQARVVGVRYHSQTEQGYNPSSLKGVRLQVNDSALGRVPSNTKAYFIDGGRNIQLLDYIFNVNSDFNSSQVAAYTFELTVDLDAVDDDKPVFP